VKIYLHRIDFYAYLCVKKSGNIMISLKVTLPTKKSGQLDVFTIQFRIANFDKVVVSVAEVKSIEELKNNTLWKVI
jgi:hypothetical protein